MQHIPTRTCDACGKVVAKRGLFWHTIEDYRTIRSDKEPSYFSDAPTTVVKEHYCSDCWRKIKIAVRNMKEENNNADN
jgi:hypothetical protein